MERDMDLIRKILFAIEESGADQRGWISLEFEGIDSEVVSYHVSLLKDAGMVDAIDASSSDGFEMIPTSMTWSGHKFLDAIRNETTWSKIKIKFGSQVSSLPLAVVSQVGIELKKKWAFEKLGIE